jgi:ketosteroid isomerase-like protein
MRRWALAVALAAIAVPAVGQVDTKLAKEMKASYNRVISAMKRKDVKAVMAEMTPDCTMKEMGQTITAKEFEPMLTQQIQMMDLQTSEIKFSKLSGKGNAAKGEYTESMKAKMKTPDGKTGIFTSLAKYRATFKKMGGKWKLHYSEAVGTPKMTLNGKPFNPMAAAPGK